MIRDAVEADAAAIAAIYNHAVEHTTAIWNEHTVDAANRADWIAERGASGLPVLVATDAAGEVIGYASFGPWRPHDGFRHTVEHSVYVRSDQQGRGIGSELLAALIGRARELGLHVMVGAIATQNTGSIALHERFGFSNAGTVRQVGAKFGEWLDLTFMQLVLDEQPTPLG